MPLRNLQDSDQALKAVMCLRASLHTNHASKGYDQAVQTSEKVLSIVWMCLCEGGAR